MNNGLANIGGDGVEAAGADNVDTFGLMKRLLHESGREFEN